MSLSEKRISAAYFSASLVMMLAAAADNGSRLVAIIVYTVTLASLGIPLYAKKHACSDDENVAMLGMLSFIYTLTGLLMLNDTRIALIAATAFAMLAVSTFSIDK